jgi:AraC family ethanolamine operon transcriptional activator
MLRGSSRLAADERKVANRARAFARLCTTAATANLASLDHRAAAHDGPDGLAAEFFEEIMETVFDPTPEHGWSARTHIVDRAWKMLEPAEQKPTVATLCEAVGVPLRTLDDAFRSCLGMRPKRFIAAMQLNKVRRQLMHPDDATNVTNTATRFGFYHFGHFSEQYRRLFGEPPQATLARGRGQDCIPTHVAAIRFDGPGAFIPEACTSSS